MDKRLFVQLRNKRIGVLGQDNHGKLNFQYDKNADKVLSLSLPLNPDKIYEESDCRAYFNGLLPEGEHIRKSIGKRYGISPENDFSLLKAIGYDCAGAVAFFEAGKKAPVLPEYLKIEGKILSDDELTKYIEELPERPLATGTDEIRLSLAGAQDKTAVVLIGDKIGLPFKNVPTTHILKPAIKDFRESVENEYICMKAAQKTGIKVPDVQIRNVNKINYFLIERYDRKTFAGKIKRIHQEDFCQACNISSIYKYENEGGISYQKCFEVLRKTSKPALEIKRFTKLIIFNYLIGNSDAHGKNFSLLHNDDGTTELAPAYDILCTEAYKELSNKMAMKIGGYYERKQIYPRHWERFADDADISYTQFKKTLKEQASALPEIVENVIQNCENSIGKEILSAVNKNCQKVLKYQW